MSLRRVSPAIWRRRHKPAVTLTEERWRHKAAFTPVRGALMKLKPNPETKYAAELRKTVGHAFCVAAALLFVSTLANSAQPTPEATMTYAELKNGFENPPLNTRPMV